MFEPNIPLARKVLEMIESHPEEWSQQEWISTCGTEKCFAGWTLVLSGHAFTVNDDEIRYLDGKIFNSVGIVETARAELGWSLGDADRVFYSMTSDPAVLRELVEEVCCERL